jgi:hypothetical protein
MSGHPVLPSLTVPFRQPVCAQGRPVAREPGEDDIPACLVRVCVRPRTTQCLLRSSSTRISQQQQQQQKTAENEKRLPWRSESGPRKSSTKRATCRRRRRNGCAAGRCGAVVYPSGNGNNQTESYYIRPKEWVGAKGHRRRQ